MKNQTENRNRSNEFREFIHYIAGLIGPSYICHFSLSNTNISDLEREDYNLGFAI